MMIELSTKQIESVSGGSLQWRSLGYSTGRVISYFYNNVMIGNGVIDDVAWLALP